MAKCKQCGSDVSFNPATQLLHCSACGADEAINTNTMLEAEQRDYDNVKEYVCPQCGGSIYTTNSTAATFCSFCGTSVVLECRDAEYVAPDSIIPFRVTEDEAKSAYLAKVKRSLFAPGYLKSDTKVEKTRGIYMPYQVARYHGEGRAAITSLHHRTSGNYDITETMRDTMHAKVEMDVSKDALHEFSDIISEGIAPFDLDDTKAYSSAYLSGFYADKADMGKDIVEGEVAQEVRELCENAVVKKAIRGNQLKRVEAMPHVKCDKAETVLCPVWFISNQQPNGSISYAAVNGQTGAVAAEIPIDKKKFLIVSGIVSLITYLILILTTSFTPHYAISVIGALALIAAYVLYEEAEELYVHNKELEGIAVPVKRSKISKPITSGAIFIICFIGWVPTIFLLMVLYELFNIAGLILAGLTAMLLFKKWLRRSSLFQKVFGRDYDVPKGALVKYIIKPIIAAVFSFLVFLINPVQDWVQYLSAAIVFVLTLWSFLDIIKVHNQMTSRKPAQLMKRGGDECA